MEQLALMIESGLSPGMAVDSLAQQQDDPRFSKILFRITEKVHTGVSISSAFSSYPDLFGPSTIILVRAGEEGGDIGGRLRRASMMLQRQLDFYAKIRHAVTSPLITATACGLVLFLVVKLVFPKFLTLYQQMDLEFPLISRLVFTGVNFLNNPITLFVMLGAVLMALFFRRELQLKLLNFLLWFPPTQNLVGKVLCASLCETLAYLHKDGVPVMRALQMITATTPFEVHRNKLENAKSVLVSTGSLSEALESMVYFPPVFHSMLAVGEESGSMDELLAANQRLMEEEIANLVSSITALLEPLIVSLMGLCMAVLFIGMFLPIYGILSKLGGA